MIRQHFTIIAQKPFKTPPMFWLSWMPLWLVQTSNSLNIKDDELSFKGSSAKMAMRHSQHWGPTFRKAPQHGLLGLFLIKGRWWCLVCKKLCFNRQSNLTIRLTHLASAKIIKIPAYPSSGVVIQDYSSIITMTWAYLGLIIFPRACLGTTIKKLRTFEWCSQGRPRCRKELSGSAMPLGR